MHTKQGLKIPIPRGTWSFKLKCLPDGTYIDICVVTVVVVSFIRKKFILKVLHSSCTLEYNHNDIDSRYYKQMIIRQVEYTNTFTQANIKVDMYIDQPRGFEIKSEKDGVLCILKIVYGIRQTSKTYYDKLRQ